MTNQVMEQLRVRGRDYPLLGEPLHACRDAGVCERMKLIRKSSSAQRRGYGGDWEIKHGRFWLSGLSASVLGPAGQIEWYDAESGLRWLFPGMAGPVSADWFTGELRSPRGRTSLADLLAERWPWLRVFHVEQGVIVGTELRDNRTRAQSPRPQPEKLRSYLDTL